MNIAWVIMIEHLWQDEVRNASYVGLLSGSFSSDAVRAILPEICAAQFQDTKAMLDQFAKQGGLPDHMQQAFAARPQTCVAHFAVLPDGSANEHRVVCDGAPNERLVALYAQNLALEMDNRYRECLRWEHQQWLGLVNGVMHRGPLLHYSLPTEPGGSLEITSE